MKEMVRNMICLFCFKSTFDEMDGEIKRRIEFIFHVIGRVVSMMES